MENFTSRLGQQLTGRAFRDIPFGDVVRWQPPQPVTPWKDVRPALIPGAACEKVEQCLFLDVFAPWPLPPQQVRGSTGGLAVMLFIHGGCNKYGEGSGLPMENLVATAADVIVVGINYRLGIFGWLGGKEVAAATPDSTNGNFGTQD